MTNDTADGAAQEFLNGSKTMAPTRVGYGGPSPTATRKAVARI